MPSIELPKLADRKLYRRIDTQASAEAAAALHAAATRTPEVRLLTSADEVLRDGNDAARDRLRDAIMSPDFAPLLRGWMRELREAASGWPDSGACTVATALKLWSWTLEHLRAAESSAIDNLSDVLCPLLAARCFVLDAVTHASELRVDISFVYAAHASALAGAACAELVFGIRRHQKWDAEGCASCYVSDDLDDLEGLFPGFASGARTSIDIIEADGSHPAKRGPCVRYEGLDAFMRLRNRLDGCLTGARMAKDRAAAAIAGRA